MPGEEPEVQTTRRVYSVRGFIVDIMKVESEGDLMYRVVSVQGLLYNNISCDTLGGLLKEVDRCLPQWIDTTERLGFSVGIYDPQLPIVEVGAVG